MGRFGDTILNRSLGPGLSVLDKTLAGKSIPEMTYFGGSSGTESGNNGRDVPQSVSLLRTEEAGGHAGRPASHIDCTRPERCVSTDQWILIASTHTHTHTHTHSE